MDSSQRAKKAELLSQAANLLGKRPHSRFDVSGDEDERFDADRINCRSCRRRRKVEWISESLPELHDHLSLSVNGDHEPVTRFEHRQHERQVVDQSRGGRKSITGNQSQQFATRTMTHSRSRQRMLKGAPDSHLGTAPKGHQSIAGPSRTSIHKAGGYTAYASLGYNEIAVNPKTSSARDYTSPSNTGDLVDGPGEVPPTLRRALTRDYEDDPPNLLRTDRYFCKHCSHFFISGQNLEQHIINCRGGIHNRATSDRTNISSSSYSEISSRKESYEGTSAKANDTRNYFTPPSSRTAYTPGVQINPVLMGGKPPGANPNTHTLQHLNPAAPQHMLQQQLRQQHFDNPQAMAAMRQQQQQLLQQQQARQLMAQQAAFQANRQDGLPTEMAKLSRLIPEGHHPRSQVDFSQELATFRQLEQEHERQARQNLAQGSDILIDKDQLFSDTDHWSQTLRRDNKESADKRENGTRRLKTDLRDPSANFSAIGHYTISQDNTEGEEARKSLLLAKFGKRCAKNRGPQEFEKQKTLRKGRV